MTWRGSEANHAIEPHAGILPQAESSDRSPNAVTTTISPPHQENRDRQRRATASVATKPPPKSATRTSRPAPRSTKTASGSTPRPRVRRATGTARSATIKASGKTAAHKPRTRSCGEASETVLLEAAMPQFSGLGQSSQAPYRTSERRSRKRGRLPTNPPKLLLRTKARAGGLRRNPRPSREHSTKAPSSGPFHRVVRVPDSTELAKVRPNQRFRRKSICKRPTDGTQPNYKMRSSQEVTKALLSVLVC